jgi:hypothetical protein
LNASSDIHVVGLENENLYWDQPLSSIYNDTYDIPGSLTYGNMPVLWAGVEIGNSGSGPTTANIESIAIVPEPGTVTLVGMGLMGMLLVVRRCKA